MNKIFKFLLSMILILTCGKVFAKEITLTYSEWSTYYPSNIPEVFIQSETRYHFYKTNDGQVEYDEGYYTELPGYIKDESSGREFYRYITNDYLIFSAYNNLVLDDAYCYKNFCYTVQRPQPLLINTDEKFESDYTNTTLPVVEAQTVPFTGDKITYYIIGFILSILITLTVLVIKRRKNNQLIRA